MSYFCTSPKQEIARQGLVLRNVKKYTRQNQL